MRTNPILQRIATLDPVKDHVEIVRLSYYYEFTWDTVRSLELAFLRTFAVPSIARLLAATQEFERAPQKRYDDTDLILSEILENGYDSERGRQALRRMNRIHSQFNISNDDMLYVLSTFVIEPYRWNQRFGYRPLCENEKIAMHAFWFELGKRMNIREVPATFEALRAFNRQYEEERFGYCEGGHQVANYMIRLFLSWYLPRWAFPLGRPFLLAILDEPLLRALGLPRSPDVAQWLAENTLKMRAWLLRFWPPRKRPKYRTQRKIRTYPDGYEVGELGAYPMRDEVEARWRK